MTGNLVPRTDNTTTLGTIDKRWKRLFTSEGLQIGTSTLQTPEDGRVEYDGTHLYFTVGSDRLQIDNQAGTGANISANAIIVEFTYTDLGSVKSSTVAVPAGAFVHRVVAVVDTAFTGGSSPACAVYVHGPTVDTSVMASNRNDLTQAKQWNVFDVTKIPTGQGGFVRLNLTGSASAGAGRVIVEFESIPTTSGVFVRTGVIDTITVQHDFAPDVEQAPFALGANAQGQLVTGLNADQLDGHHGSYFQTADATLTALAGLSTSAGNLILVTGSDTFSVGQLTDTYVDSLSQSKTHGSADTDSGTSSLHHTIGTGQYQAAAGNHTHSTYVRIGTSDTITAQHSFSPGTSVAPFTLGTNAQGQLVTGLNADQLDGHDASYFQTADATLTALAGLSTSTGNLILVTGSDTFSVGQLTDTYVDSLSQSKTHGSADTDSATTALHHTLGTGSNQAAAGNHTHSTYVRIGTSDTITAQHSFSPGTSVAPFTLGTNAQGQLVTGLNADQVDGEHASGIVTFSRVQTVLGAATSAVGFNSKKLTGVANPDDAQDAATKSYVDGLVSGLHVKDSTKALSDANIASLSGSKTIDNVSCVAGNRVLLIAQGTASQNGFWIVQTSAWTRPSDFATGAGAAAAFSFIESGDTYKDTGWVCTNNAGSDVIDTNDLTFVQFSAAGQIVAGDGLDKLGTTIFITAADSSITVNTNSIQVGTITDSNISTALSQSKTHGSDDTDDGTSSLHHTIGTGQYQAAAGNHTHSTYVRIGTSDTITAQHSFSPGTSVAPFTLGTNAQGQLVTGLNADQLDGHDGSYFQTADATLTALAGLSTSSGNLILVTGSDTFSVGQLTDTYVDSLSQSKTHGSADTDSGTSSLHHTIGTGQYQAAAGNHAHSTYVRIGTSDTITAQHSFSPGTSVAPFTLGTNAQGQLVTGLNADQLDGHDGSYYQTADATLTALAGLSTSSGNLILVTGSDTFSVGQLTDTYVDSLSQSKTHGSADTDSGTSSLHHTIGTGQYQAAAGNHTHSGTYQPADATLTALAGLSTSANNLILVTGTDTFSVGQLTDTYIASANKDGVAGTASMRTLGTGSQQAAAGNHSHAIAVTFSYTDIGTPKSSTATIPSEAVVIRVVVIVSGAFTGGSSPTCLVEVDGSSTDTTISSTSQSNLSVAGQYATTDLTDVPSGQGGAVRVTLGGTASAGSGKVFVEYMLPAT